MKAISFSETGGPEVLKYTDLPDPLPGPHEIIIENKFLGVNFADIYRRRGEFESEPPSPYVPGHEGAGIVRQVGSQVREFLPGQRVAFAHVPRSNAQLVKAPAWKVIPLPDGISLSVAASVLLQGLTAHYLTHDSHAVLPHQTALVHSASGGVGSLLVQICRILGAKTIGTVSTPDKIPQAVAAGADYVIVRSQGDWKSLVFEKTGGQGVQVGYDAIGSTLADTLSVVKPGGTAVFFGWAGGEPPKIDPVALMADSKKLVGGELWSHISDRESLLGRSETLFQWIIDGRLKPQIFGTYPLAEAAQAHRLLESGKTTGKILLSV